MTLKIKTNESLVENVAEMNNAVAKFWDQISEGWYEIWGPHIHHGYYERTDISQREAQEQLIDKLTQLLTISSSAKILDVGCGMGGSSIYLAKHFGAEVTGITLSPKQVLLAQQQAKHEQLHTVNFKIDDALKLHSIANESIDIVWSLESCEQFFNKALFVSQAHRVLKEHGLLMLATWCSSQEEYQNAAAKKYKKLCYAFDLPYMPTIAFYKTILREQGFRLEQCFDWSSQVKVSWEKALLLLKSFSYAKLVKLGGWRGLRFVNQLKLMRNAFEQGTVKYAVFVAVKGSSPLM